MSKNIPNPNGRKGKDDHQSMMESIFKQLLDLFHRVKKEGKIDISDTKYRFGDIVAYDEDNRLIEIHQVGRTNKDGSPVARERKAMEEIEKSRGIKVIFHALIAIVILALTILIIT